MPTTRGFTNKAMSSFAARTQKSSIPPAPKKQVAPVEEEEDLEIPAFIRKKMGL